MSRLKYILSFIWIGLAILSNSILFVSAQGVISFDYRRLGGGYDGPDQMQGWEFVPNVDMCVVQLGLYDGQERGGFRQEHTVGLWDAYPQMIASASFPAGSSVPLIGSFRFVDITPTFLRAGETYVIGAYMPGPGLDYASLFLPSEEGTTGPHVSPLINLTAYRAGLSPGGISFPESRFEGFLGAFGPNFVIASTPPVPIIRSFQIDSNIVLRSSPGTNIFSLIPEYKANLNDLTWMALTTFSNRFVNGTNETFCRRPPGSNLFIRLRAQVCP
jgi:hypothetical protein